LKLGAADGFFQRPETRMVTVIGPLSDPRPMPYRPLPTAIVSRDGQRQGLELKLIAKPMRPLKVIELLKQI
jgi:hypothetical protein